MSTTPFASPPLDTPWIPTWPLAPARLGELAYAERQGTFTVPVSSQAAAATVVTAPAITLDGNTPILIEFYCHSAGFTAAAASGVLSVNLWDGSTDLQRLAGVSGNSSFAMMPVVSAQRRLTPTAGTHTYSIRAYCLGTAGTMSAENWEWPMALRISLAAPLLSAPPGAAVAVQYGTSLPTNPLDGQEAILVDSVTNPSYQWRFRYNAGSTSAYKWEFVGGTQGFAVIATAETVATAGSFQNAATPGPLFTVPRSGIYLVRGSALMNKAVEDQIIQIGVDVGDWVTVPRAQATSSIGIATGWTTPVATGQMTLTAAEVLRVKYYHQIAGTDLSIQNRQLMVIPAKVS